MNYYQWPRYTPPYVRTPENGTGTVALICGVLGLMFSFVPLIGIIAWPLVLVGLITGGVGWDKANAQRATNKGSAILGVVLSFLGMLVCFGWLIAISR